MIQCDYLFPFSQPPTANTWMVFWLLWTIKSRNTTPVALWFFWYGLYFHFSLYFLVRFSFDSNLRTWNTRWRHLYANYHLSTVLYSVYTQICFPLPLLIFKTSHLWYFFSYSICSPLEYFIQFHDLEYYSHYITMTPKSKSPAMNKWIWVTD